MTENSISILALSLGFAPGILHSVEVAYPLLVRWLVNYVLPLFGPGLPKGSSQNLTAKGQIAMLDAALSAAPKAKRTAQRITFL